MIRRVVPLLLSLLVAVPVTSVMARRAPHRPAVAIPSGWPRHFSIPVLKVQANVESVPMNQIKDIDAPFNVNDVAWYSRGPKPGEPGHATIVGHLDSTCCPAIFFHLKYLKAGQTVQVAYKSGKPLTFKVIWNNTYPDKSLPIKWLYGPSTQRGLILLTCAGDFHYDGSGYDHRQLVYARLVLPNGQLG